MYEAIKIKAARMIRNYGRRVQVQRHNSTGPDFDPNVTYRGQQAYAVITDFTSDEVNDLVQQTDKKVIIQVNKEVSVKDRIQDGNTTYEVISVKTVQPGPMTLIQILQVRQ